MASIIAIPPIPDKIILNEILFDLESSPRYPLGKYLRDLSPPITFDKGFVNDRAYEAIWTNYDNTLYLENVLGVINRQNVTIFDLFRESLSRGEEIKANMVYRYNKSACKTCNLSYISI